MKRLTAAALTVALLLPFAAEANAQAAEKVKEAVRTKASGNTAEAVRLYEEILDADRQALAEPDGGLRDDLFAKYEAAAEGGDLAALLKLAQYYELFGRADDALAAYGKVASGSDPALAEQARAAAASLRKEGELARSGAGRSPDSPTGVGSGDMPPPDSGGEAPPPDSGAEAPPADGGDQPAPQDNSEQRAQLEERLKALETELAAAEEEMQSRKRKWKQADGGNYDGDMRRRYRQAEEIHEGKAKEIEEIKQQIQALDAGNAPPADSGDAPSSSYEGSEEIVPAENSDTPSEPPSDDNGGY